MSKQRLKQNIGYLAGGAVALFFFLVPLCRLALMSLTTDQGFGLDNYAALLAESRTLRAIGNTVIIAVASTLIAVVLGSLLAFLVAYTDLAHKKWIEILTLAPFVIPSYIITLSWSTLLSARGSLNQFLDSAFGFKVNIYSLGGIILVLGICNAPVVYLNVLPFLRKIPRDLEWAARVCGRSLWQTVRCIDLTQAAPAVASGGMLAFLAAIDNFSVPAFLGIPAGIPVLSTYIYENVIGFGPSAFRSAAALSVLLSAIALTGTALQGLLVKKSSGMESIREDFSVRVPLGRARLPVQWITLGFLALVNIFPLITTITSSFFPACGTRTLANFTLENYRFVFTNRGIRQAFLNSALLAAATCLICILVGTALACRKVRRRCPASRLVEQSASLTYAIPGSVLALAMADRIIIMKEGRIEQVGTPEEIYYRPKTLFAATFVSKCNLVRGRWEGDCFWADAAAGQNQPFARGPVESCFREAGVCPVRPEEFTMTRIGMGLEGRVVNRQWGGREIHYKVECGTELFTVYAGLFDNYAEGDRVVLQRREAAREIAI